jgi:CHASE1-domain containing sensor protein
MPENLKGIQGVGFAIVVPAHELAAHTAWIRSQGFPEYSIWPKGNRDVYTSVIFIEPFSDRNLRAFGYDMWSEPVRRQALTLAHLHTDRENSVGTGNFERRAGWLPDVFAGLQERKTARFG